jgi:DNA-binding Lrp family transcriptional regulator
MTDEPVLDPLDLALLTALRASPRAGILELSRAVGVARATVQSRLERMERTGVITGYGPDINVAAAGYPVQAFVTLEIAQGALEKLHRDLSSIPGVLEAYATTGTGDILCRVAAASNAELQQTLLALNGSPWVARSTSAVLLSTVIAPRVMPLLSSRPRIATTRAPAFRGRSRGGTGEPEGGNDRPSGR